MLGAEHTMFLCIIQYLLKEIFLIFGYFGVLMCPKVRQEKILKSYNGICSWPDSQRDRISPNLFCWAGLATVHWLAGYLQRSTSI